MSHRSSVLDSVKGKSIAAGLRPGASDEAKGDSKKLAPREIDWKLRQARVFLRVLQLGEMTLKECAYALGFADQSEVSRWASAAARPQWDRIAEVEQLAPWISVAWGEATGADVHVAVIVKRSA